MPRFPARSSRQVEELLAHFGFRLDRVRGSHGIWVPPTGTEAIPVLRNKRSIPRGTVRAVLRQAGITRAQALEFWKMQ